MSLNKQSSEIKNRSYNKLNKQATQYDSAVKIKLSQLRELPAESEESNSLSGDGSFFIRKDSPLKGKTKILKMSSMAVMSSEDNLAQKKNFVKLFSSGINSPVLKPEEL